MQKSCTTAGGDHWRAQRVGPRTLRVNFSLDFSLFPFARDMGEGHPFRYVMRSQFDNVLAVWSHIPASPRARLSSTPPERQFARRLSKISKPSSKKAPQTGCQPLCHYASRVEEEALLKVLQLQAPELAAQVRLYRFRVDQQVAYERGTRSAQKISGQSFHKKEKQLCEQKRINLWQKLLG